MGYIKKVLRGIPLPESIKRYIRDLEGIIRRNSPISVFISVKAGIKNLIKWFPVIWRDRDFDWMYLIEIIDHKLKYMEKCQRNGHHTQCEKYADEIDETRRILDRIINDYWFDLYYSDCGFGGDNDVHESIQRIKENFNKNF